MSKNDYPGVRFKITQHKKFVLEQVARPMAAFLGIEEHIEKWSPELEAFLREGCSNTEWLDHVSDRLYRIYGLLDESLFVDEFGLMKRVCEAVRGQHCKRLRGEL